MNEQLETNVNQTHIQYYHLNMHTNTNIGEAEYAIDIKTSVCKKKG